MPTYGRARIITITALQLSSSIFAMSLKATVNLSNDPSHRHRRNRARGSRSTLQAVASQSAVPTVALRQTGLARSLKIRSSNVGLLVVGVAAQEQQP